MLKIGFLVDSSRQVDPVILHNWVLQLMESRLSVLLVVRERPFGLLTVLAAMLLLNDSRVVLSFRASR